MADPANRKNWLGRAVDTLANTETNPLALAWRMLPPEARKAYSSLPSAIGELSPGAAIRDTVQASGETANAAMQGRGWDAAGGVANMLTAAAGVVPGSKLVTKGAKNVLSTMSKKPAALYHVAGPEYEAGQPLRSLYARKGNAAYDEFAQRWPEAGGVGQDHAHKVMFYDSIDDALEHAEMFGGNVFKVNPSKVDDLYLDTLEKSYDRQGYWATRRDVPPDALENVAQGKR